MQVIIIYSETSTAHFKGVLPAAEIVVVASPLMVDCFWVIGRHAPPLNCDASNYDPASHPQYWMNNKNIYTR